MLPKQDEQIEVFELSRRQHRYARDQGDQGQDGQCHLTALRSAHPPFEHGNSRGERAQRGCQRFLGVWRGGHACGPSVPEAPGVKWDGCHANGAAVDGARPSHLRSVMRNTPAERDTPRGIDPVGPVLIAEAA